MNEDLRKYLEGVAWGITHQKLEAFALSMAKLYFGRRYKNLPKGYTYEDVVQRAIRMGVEKTWAMFDVEEFETYLFGAVKSILWGLVISEENKTTRPILHGQQREESEDESLNGNKTAIKIDADVGEKIDYENIIGAIRTEIRKKNNSEELERVFDRIREGYEPKQIAERTKISPQRVTNCKRQLLVIVENIANNRR